MKNISQMMKQAQSMQANIKQMQADIAQTTLEGTAGNGMVKVVMGGDRFVKSIAIDPKVLSENQDMLEDLLVLAINDGVKKIETLTAEKMATATAGIKLPPGFSF